MMLLLPISSRSRTSRTVEPPLCYRADSDRLVLAVSDLLIWTVSPKHEEQSEEAPSDRTIPSESLRSRLLRAAILLAMQ